MAQCQRELKHKYRRCDTGLCPVGLHAPLVPHVLALGLQRHPSAIANNENTARQPTREPAFRRGLHTDCLVGRRGRVANRNLGGQACGRTRKGNEGCACAGENYVNTPESHKTMAGTHTNTVDLRKREMNSDVLEACGLV